MWESILECYKGIGDKDGFNGVMSTFEGNQINMFALSQQKRLYDRNWVSYWSASDTFLQANKGSGEDLLVGLANSGHFSTLGKILGQKLESNVDSTNHYMTLWRLGKWEQVEDVTNDSNPIHYEIFRGLRALYDSHRLVLDEAPKMDQCCVTTKNLCLVEINEAKHVLSGSLNIKSLVALWEHRFTAIEGNTPFEDMETVLAVRQKILHSFSNRQEPILKASKPDIISSMRQQIKMGLEIAIKDNEFVIARRLSNELQKSFDNLEQSKMEAFEIQITALDIEWLGGERDIALRFLDILIKNVSNLKNEVMKAQVLHKYASWCIKSKKLSPVKIINEYLEPASKLVTQGNRLHLEKYPIYFDFAMYCDELHTNMESDETHKRAVVLLKQRENDLSQLRKLAPTLSSSAMTEVHIRKLTRQISLDQIAIAAFEREKLSYAMQSCKNHLKSLISSNRKTEHSVFRFLSQWFGNFQVEEMNEMVHKKLRFVSSSKLLDVLHQSTARLFAKNPDGSKFYHILADMVLQIVVDFPYHSLGFILAAKNVSREKRGTVTLSSESISAFLSRIKAHKEVHQIAYGMDGLFTAYILLANDSDQKSRAHDPSKHYNIDKGSKLFKIDEKSKIPVITASPQMISPRDYESLVYICKFEKTFTIPGGFHIIIRY